MTLNQDWDLRILQLRALKEGWGCDHDPHEDLCGKPITEPAFQALERIRAVHYLHGWSRPYIYPDYDGGIDVGYMGKDKAMEFACMIQPDGTIRYLYLSKEAALQGKRGPGSPEELEGDLIRFIPPEWKEGTGGKV